MKKPVLVDLYCKAGGAAMGYHRAGFEVIGVDIEAQPHFPFAFCQMDALEALTRLVLGNTLGTSDGKRLRLTDITAFHASPPCKADNQGVLCRQDVKTLRETYPRLIAPTRAALRDTSRPFVIENVPLARAQLLNPMMLCGTMFGLRVKRHRYFELHGFEIPFAPAGCDCKGRAGFTNADRGRSAFAQGARLISVAGHNFKVDDAQQAMGIAWMTGEELSQAVPPVYTEFIGKYLIATLRAQ